MERRATDGLLTLTVSGNENAGLLFMFGGDYDSNFCHVVAARMVQRNRQEYNINSSRHIWYRRGTVSECDSERLKRILKVNLVDSFCYLYC